MFIQQIIFFNVCVSTWALGVRFLVPGYHTTHVGGNIQTERYGGRECTVLLIFRRHTNTTHLTFELNVNLQTHFEIAGNLSVQVGSFASYFSFYKCLTVFLTCFLLQKPERDEWGSGTEALECALQLERSVNQSLLDLHKLCSDHTDPHVSIKWLHSKAP